mgnify:CR=1 FL=1
MVKRIVLTGGPGSGKTSVLEKINQVYSSEGYKVIIVPETATELMNNGITFKEYNEYDWNYTMNMIYSDYFGSVPE